MPARLSKFAGVIKNAPAGNGEGIYHLGVLAESTRRINTPGWLVRSWLGRRRLAHPVS